MLKTRNSKNLKNRYFANPHETNIRSDLNTQLQILHKNIIMFPEKLLFSRQYVNGSHNIFEILAEMRSETTCAFPETEQSTSETANQSCREVTKTIPYDRDPEIYFPTHRTYKKEKEKEKK